jgi:hypothetical protein
MSTVAGQELTEFLKALGRTRLSVNFVELFTALIFMGRMEARMVSTLIPIPPRATITITYKVPLDKVVLCPELGLSFDRDRALQIFVSIDNKLVIEDYDAVMDNYRVPTNLFQLGALLPIKDNITVVIKNRTNQLVNLNHRRVCGFVDKTIFTTVMERYFRTVLGEIGGV